MGNNGSFSTAAAEPGCRSADQQRWHGVYAVVADKQHTHDEKHPLLVALEIPRRRTRGDQLDISAKQV